MYFNTKIKNLYGKKICIYCAKEAKEKIDFDYSSRSSEYYYNCDCDGAKIEIKKEEKIKSVSNEYDRKLDKYVFEGRKLISDLIYDMEIKKAENTIKYIKEREYPFESEDDVSKAVRYIFID